MREIKYRGKERITGIWRKSDGPDVSTSEATGEWREGNLEQLWSGDGTLLVARITGNNTCGDAVTAHEVWPETVGQRTGKHDQEGREIWEGDLVEEESLGLCAIEWTEEGGFIAMPVEHPENWVWLGGTICGEPTTDRMRVIGNKWDNAGRLRQGKEAEA